MYEAWTDAPEERRLVSRIADGESHRAGPICAPQPSVLTANPYQIPRTWPARWANPARFVFRSGLR